MLKLYQEIYKLKTALRKGWIVRKVPSESGRYESIAEHTFSTLVLADYLMEKESFDGDRLKVLRLVLYHDFSEIDAGDKTPYEIDDKNQRFYEELKCIDRIAEQYDIDYIRGLWKEFECGVTKEAEFARKIDKLDAVLQAKIYEKINSHENLCKEFYENAKGIIDDFDKYI